MKVALDELEVMIGFIQATKPEFKKATYKQLAEEIKKDFNIEVSDRDIFLLYEPTLEEEQTDLQLQFENLLYYV